MSVALKAAKATVTKDGFSLNDVKGSIITTKKIMLAPQEIK